MVQEKYIDDVNLDYMPDFVFKRVDSIFSILGQTKIKKALTYGETVPLKYIQLALTMKGKKSELRIDYLEAALQY